jgi:hypothetical protein
MPTHVHKFSCTWPMRVKSASQPALASGPPFRILTVFTVDSKPKESTIACTHLLDISVDANLHHADNKSPYRQQFIPKDKQQNVNKQVQKAHSTLPSAITKLCSNLLRNSTQPQALRTRSSIPSDSGETHGVVRW